MAHGGVAPFVQIGGVPKTQDDAGPLAKRGFHQFDRADSGHITEQSLRRPQFGVALSAEEPLP
jgi:hypothetical protein